MNERQNKIFSILSKRPRVTVMDLSFELGVSGVTIRKDLTALENEGILKRTHGGAAQIALDSVEKRMAFRYEEKLRIVKKGIELVEDGETILLEAGSTNTIFARELANCKSVHIITNSLYIPKILKQNINAKVTILGGEFQPEPEAMVGPLTIQALGRICVNKAFIGMDGFNEKLGFTCSDFLRAEVGREMCNRADKVIFLAESTKFDNSGVTPIAELSKVDMVVTDGEIAIEKVKILKRNNVQIILAQ